MTAGAAPTIEATPANGTTIVPKQDIESRQPLNLTQAVENVAGVSSVSEGQAAVPAIRGLARGRSLILLDGARVSSERRVGPSATYVDPFVLDGVEVARGPGSVAYGSDAFGGVIAARTLAVAPGAPLSVEATGDYGVGIPGAASEPRSPRRSAPTEASSSPGTIGPTGTGTAPTARSSTRASATAAFSREPRTCSVRERSRRGGRATMAGTSTGPATTRRSVRFYYPEENSSRFTLSYDGQPFDGFLPDRLRRPPRLATTRSPTSIGSRRRATVGVARAAPTYRPTTSRRAASPSVSSARCASSSASTSTAGTASTPWTSSSATPTPSEETVQRLRGRRPPHRCRRISHGRGRRCSCSSSFRAACDTTA